MTAALVTCRNCGEDFAADDGSCPGCGHARVEPGGIPAGDLCASCGRQRYGLTGLPLVLGDMCVCGSRAIRVARKRGEVVGEVLNEAGPIAVGSHPASLSTPTAEGEVAA